MMAQRKVFNGSFPQGSQRPTVYDSIMQAIEHCNENNVEVNLEVGIEGTTHVSLVTCTDTPYDVLKRLRIKGD